ncbi:guanine nucleotide-binding protein subunit alpha homolog isoform X2 [Portunus trituberculatus]|uniref:guanine nucleotide-binding protein subunit alpha homolog isoform X2 n=1 Tax=Portunus trituberculatus TaxID=210409 RepID=UPI001E1CB4C4|nr:guanine nucleotide-binding protein subunit alpha homolog isoform X2 [Portunus trituberculatus]
MARLTVLSCSCCLRALWTPEEMDQHRRSQEIDKVLQKERERLRRQVKLLLLGAGESGKSTFLKQMRIIHGYRFGHEEIDEYRETIYKNIVMGMKVLVDARDKLRIPWEDDTRESVGKHLMKYMSYMPLDRQVFLEYVPSIRDLWKDTGIRQAYNRRAEFQLEYIPTEKDILHCRKATKAITEFTIPIQNVPFLFVDVGGQRTQRQKWFQCFESVTSIIFLASSSEFDQRLLEDRVTNRLEESLNIFGTIVNNRNFRDVSIILFLNKTDLLIQKIRSRQSNIAHYFTDFVGNPHDERCVQQFILHKFVEQRRGDTTRRPLFHHFTTAVDTENIKVVFNSVKDTILQRNLETLMLQ